MSHDFPPEALSDPQGHELLDDLELRCRTGVATARGPSVRRVSAHVAVRPANVVERDRMLELRTSEIAPQWLTGFADLPVMVGNVFHLTFERRQIDATATLAVCDRCTMLAEASFELRFRFVRDLDLAGAGGAT